MSRCLAEYRPCYTHSSRSMRTTSHWAHRNERRRGCRCSGLHGNRCACVLGRGCVRQLLRRGARRCWRQGRRWIGTRVVELPPRLRADDSIDGDAAKIRGNARTAVSVFEPNIPSAGPGSKPRDFSRDCSCTTRRSSRTPAQGRLAAADFTFKRYLQVRCAAMPSRRSGSRQAVHQQATAC